MLNVPFPVGGVKVSPRRSSGAAVAMLAMAAMAARDLMYIIFFLWFCCYADGVGDLGWGLELEECVGVWWMNGLLICKLTICKELFGEELTFYNKHANTSRKQALAPAHSSDMYFETGHHGDGSKGSFVGCLGSSADETDCRMGKVFIFLFGGFTSVYYMYYL